MAGVLEQSDQDVFQRIFEEHWEHFKKHWPYFDCAQYNDAVAKMLGCGREVKYWYNDHKSKGKKIETILVFVFIGRMVQHIMPMRPGPKAFRGFAIMDYKPPKLLESGRMRLLREFVKSGKSLKGLIKWSERKMIRSVTGRVCLIPCFVLYVEP